jgi:hypothetical protein
MLTMWCSAVRFSVGIFLIVVALWSTSYRRGYHLYFPVTSTRQVTVSSARGQMTFQTWVPRKEPDMCSNALYSPIFSFYGFGVEPILGDDREATFARCKLIRWGAPPAVYFYVGYVYPAVLAFGFSLLAFFRSKRASVRVARGFEVFAESLICKTG